MTNDVEVSSVTLSDSSELPGVVAVLLDTLNDKNNDVILAVHKALKKISHSNPEIVIHASIYYFELHRKILTTHANAILTVMIETLRDQATKLSDDLADSVADLAIGKLIIQECEKEASELLVALSRLYCNQAMGSLLNKLEPRTIPPCPILRAMGLVASCNPFGMVPFIKLTLSFILPMLSEVQEDVQKQTFCFIFGKFSEAINDYIVNLDEAPDSRIGKDTFYDEMMTAFECITNIWLKSSKNIKLTESILSALCCIFPILPDEDVGAIIGRLIPTLLNYCKIPITRLSSTRLIAILLINCTKNFEEKEVIRPYIDSIQQIIFELVNVTPFEAFRDALLTHYEVLQCYRDLVILFPEEGLDRILQYLRSPINLQRNRAFIVVRHLINTLPPEDDVSLQRIALSIQNILGDSNVKQLVGPIIALIAHPSLSLLPSQRTALIRFIVLKCGITNEKTQAYEEALFLVATTVDGAENWLWSALLKIFLDPTYTISIISVLRSLTALSIKIIQNENTCNSISSFKEFSGTKILARCLQLLDNERNRLSVINFLQSSASLFGHQLKPEWDERLQNMLRMLEYDITNEEWLYNKLVWEREMVDFLEKSVQLEGTDWAAKLSKELASETLSPGVSIYLAAVTDNEQHLSLLIHSSRTQSFNSEYPRAVGIASKRHLQMITNLMEAACEAEDSKKNPTRLLGLMRDAKAAATLEASKANLLRCYGEIFKRGNVNELYEMIDKHILPWILKQLNECKELTSKEAGLFALEQLGEAINPESLNNSVELKGKSRCLATLLPLLGSHSGYRPIQLYPQLLKTFISLLKIPPELSCEELQVLMGTILDKVIGASSDIDVILPVDDKHKVVDELGEVCSEIINDSIDALADLVDILMPWMQSKLAIERKVTLMLFCTALKSYISALKVTFPDGKLEPGKLLGRIICWSADNERSLRSLTVNAVGLTLEIVAKHRSATPDNKLNKDLQEAKRILMGDDFIDIYCGIKLLSRAVCQRVTNDEIISLAEGLIEGLLYREQRGLAAGIVLSQLFKIRGAEIPRSDLYLIDNIVGQMRQLENASCRRSAATAIKSLTLHHPEEVMEHLLHQPLPPDQETEECWKQLGSDEETGLIAVDFINNRLENNHLFCQASPSNRGINDKNSTASLASLSGIIALRHLLQASQAEILIKKRLAALVTVLIKYLSGWVHAEAPVSVLSTKFGFVPNRKACKINPYREVYAVLTNLLTVIDMSTASSILNDVTESDFQVNESLIATIRSVIRCLMTENIDLLINIAQSLGKLVTSQIYTQRAAVIAIYSELIGKVNCGSVWLDAIINTLLEAKSDSSYLVRKFAIIGIGSIHCLDTKPRDEYLDNCIMALIDGLEEPSNNNEGSQVVLESLRGLDSLLSLKTEKPVSPSIILSLKPFVEKDNWEIRLAAIGALGAVSRGWLKSVKSNDDDDVTDHLLGCIPCLSIKLEDPNENVAKAAKETLYEMANLLQCDPLTSIIRNHLAPTHDLSVENLYRDLVNCLIQELPSRAEELRNAIVRGYSRSEVGSIRSTSVLILGFFGRPGPEDVQRMLQLLRDKDSMVKLRAAKAIALGFTI